MTKVCDKRSVIMSHFEMLWSTSIYNFVMGIQEKEQWVSSLLILLCLYHRLQYSCLWATRVKSTDNQSISWQKDFKQRWQQGKSFSTFVLYLEKLRKRKFLSQKCLLLVGLIFCVIHSHLHPRRPLNMFTAAQVRWPSSCCLSEHIIIHLKYFPVSDWWKAHA